MLPELERLLVIQGRDQKLRAIRHELKSVPLEKAALEEKIKAAGQHVEHLKGRIKELEVERNKLEVDVKSKEDAIAKFKTQQQQTRKNDEYQALTNEIERFGSDIVGLEDQELELMEQTEKLSNELKTASSLFDEDKAKIDARIKDIEQKKMTLETQEKETLEEREKLVAPIDDDLMDTYERLMKSKKDAAIVTLEHDVCKGCNVKLTTQTAVKVKGGKQIVHCENCGRILYEG